MFTQSEAEYFMNMSKKKVSNNNYDFPLARESLVIPIISTDDKVNFLLDINRKGEISLTKCTKCTYQERYQEVNILVRLDLDGPTHENPFIQPVPLTYLEPYNGSVIPTPHLHLYVEGFMDKWAIPANNRFPRTSDLFLTLEDFFQFCNIIEPPAIQRGLFV
ncbi:MAG: hypothetical protein AAB116_04595 [Candidatus Poribacteria bacterium]|mgnify:CR=1 FL=1